METVSVSEVPCSPYLGPDPESPVLSPRTTRNVEPNSFIITPAKPGSRKRVSMVGGYKLGRTLGKGSCGVVKLGTHLESGKRVAVKVLRPKNEREKNEIRREIDALRQLKHPNIIQLLDVIWGSDLVSSTANGADQDANAQCLEKYIFIVLELASGGELFEKVLHGGALREEESRRCFRQILSALTFTHAHLICHRDLKPENILFDSEGNVKISDFGLSNSAQPGRLFGTWCGSPMYAPPEVVMEQKYKGWSVDVWSLGIILYVMVTGGMPWRLERGQVRDMELFLAASYQVPDDMGISEECKDLLDRMIQSNPAERASLREMCNHPWITNNGRLSPPDSQLPVPENLSMGEPRADGKYSIDEGLLFQVQETIGLDRKGMFEARAQVASMSPGPALTAYSKLLQLKTQRSAQAAPAVVHRRTRSEGTPSLGASPSALRAPSIGASPSVSRSLIPEPPVTTSMTVCVSDDTPESPFSPTAARRPRASTSPAAYNKIAAFQEMSFQAPAAHAQTPRFDPDMEIFRQDKTRREAKQGTARHLMRVLMLKLRFGKKN